MSTTIGGACVLAYVSGAVERAAALSACVFVRGFHGEMGLCPICHDGFDLGGYGVLARLLDFI